MKLAALFIALSLSVCFFYLIQPWAFGVDGNSINPWVFSAMSKHGHFKDLWEVWHPRVAGLFIAGRLFDLCANAVQYQNVFAAYQAAWLMAFFVMIIIMVREPIFVIFGVFAGLMYIDTPSAHHYHWPWDMPSMLFFTLSFLLWLCERYGAMLLVILGGYLFKETVLVTAILFFCTAIPLRQRLGYFLAAVILTTALKFIVLHHVDGHITLLTQDLGQDDSHKMFQTLWDNLHSLFSLRLNHFAFVNGGGTLVMLLLPARSACQRGMKVLLLVFFAGELFAGCFDEFRIMLEALPLSVLYLQDRLSNK